MGNEKYTEVDMITIVGDIFYEGYKFAVEVACLLETQIREEYHAKHKKIINTLIEDMKKTLATLDKDVVRKVAENYLRDKRLREEILNRKEEEIIKQPTAAQVARLTKKE